MPGEPEFWLRGPVPGVPAALMPVAHALLQARADVRSAAPSLSVEDLWRRPGGAASAGFHLRHLAGSLDRLLTYARGEPLDDAQLAALRREREPEDPAADAAALVAEVEQAIDRALDQVRRTPESSLGEARSVGRAGLPSTVLGLLFHAAEHTTRHAGQLITTARILGAAGGAAEEPAAVLRRLHSALEQHDVDALVSCFHTDYRSEQPLHPEREFTGTEPVRRNWSALFDELPDFHAQLLRWCRREEQVWAEWRWTGTTRDGAHTVLAGTTIFAVRDGQIAWARLYVEPVQQRGAAAP